MIAMYSFFTFLTLSEAAVSRANMSNASEKISSSSTSETSSSTVALPEYKTCSDFGADDCATSTNSYGDGCEWAGFIWKSCKEKCPTTDLFGSYTREECLAYGGACTQEEEDGSSCRFKTLCHQMLTTDLQIGDACLPARDQGACVFNGSECEPGTGSTITSTTTSSSSSESTVSGTVTGTSSITSSSSTDDTEFSDSTDESDLTSYASSSSSMIPKVVLIGVMSAMIY